jgi:hypothetical protein
LARRQKAFASGAFKEIHQDKFMQYQAGVEIISSLGLGHNSSGSLRIEPRTAGEYMAALALTLCNPGETWQVDDEGLSHDWVPITNRKGAAEALLAGLVPDKDESAFEHRVLGDSRVSDIRGNLLEEVLPVPTGPVPVDAIVAFRKRHGDLLPRLRRSIEEEIDRVEAIADQSMRRRRLDRLADELDERVQQAETYLQESVQRRVARSSLFRWAKLVPAGRAAGVVQEQAQASLREPEFTREPLAYLAFARAQFAPRATYRINPLTGIPLTDAIQA